MDDFEPSPNSKIHFVLPGHPTGGQPKGNYTPSDRGRASPMPSDTSDRRKILCSLALAIMFLFADLALPNALPQWEDETLDDEVKVSFTTTTSSVFKDTGIDSFNASSSYGSDANFTLGSGTMGEGRILISFNNTIANTEVVEDATLELTCGIDPADIDDIHIYVSRMKKNWNASNSNWNGPDVGVQWGQPGADDSADRGNWEPPFYGYDNNTFQINVTALVQDAVMNGRATVDFLIAATGAQYLCHLSESATSSNQPQLTVIHSTGTAGSGGALTPDFVEDGAALMDDSQFILTAASNPDLSWSSLSGNDVQIQLSLSPEFKSESDDTWFYNTVDNSSMFTISGSSGVMTVPSGDELSNATSMFYRMRTIDSTATFGDWTTGYFHLPGHSITDNGDNTATLSIGFDDLGLDDDTIEDTFVDSSNIAKNSNMGSDGTMTVGASSNSDQLGLIRLHLDDIGLHSNATIVSASMGFTRDSSSGSALVSMHVMENDVWTEDGVTWRKYDGTYYWDDGGRTQSMSVDTFEGDQSSSSIDVNITAAVQQWLDLNAQGTTDSTLELMMAASTWGRDVSSTTSVTLETTETGSGNDPVLTITYAYGSGSAPTLPSHTSPLDGHAVWNLSVDNLTGNTTPDLVWDGSLAGSDDMLMQVSTDPDYRDIIHSFDTSVDNDFTASDGTWTPTGTDSLDTGVMYHWRMAHRDSGGHHGWWQTSSFLVSDLESEYLQDDEHRLRLSHGNATTAGDAPHCGDTYIDSGLSTTNYNGEEEMQVSYNTFPSETSILLGCDLTSHLLPTGYAVKTATLKMRLADYPNGNPTVGAYESFQHNWTEEGATWASYDGTNSWGTAGAKGWERGGLLDSEELDSAYSAGDWVELDITLAVQNAMREDRAVDLVIAILGIGSGSDRDALFYPNNVNSANRPEISFVYVPGSDALPTEPVPALPLNDSWSVESGINPAPVQDPQLSWNFNNANVTVGGWSVELDTSPNFDSGNIVMATSWNDNGFDVANKTYDMDGQLAKGNTWYWRVRATSDTNQIGNWSNVYSFKLPDVTTWSINSNSAAVELHHQEAMPSLNLPNFIDTWVADSGTGSSTGQSSSGTMLVGTNSNGDNATGLMKIPLTELPNPQNAHIANATLHLYAQFGSDTGNSVSIHPASVAWNTSANGTTYDGTNNWSALGAMGANDAGVMSDVLQGDSANWMSFDVTELVQAAFANSENHLSLVIRGSIGEGQTIFTTTEGNSNEKPWLNMTWVSGNASTAAAAGTNSNPLNDEIIWDTSTHALLPGEDPVFSWAHSSSSSVDDWRLFIWDDHTDVRAGWTVYDSRDGGSGWDVTNMTWTSTAGLDAGDSYRWFVQPVTGDILGARGNTTIFHLPAETGATINSTDANLSLQSGMIVEALNYPDIFVDTYIDSGSTMTSFSSSTDLVMGQSPSSTNHYAISLMSIDWSNIPIPGNHEFVNSTLTLNRLSGGELNQETVTVAVCEADTTWNENATFNSPTGNNTSWQYSRQPCASYPFHIFEMDYQDTTVDIDVTYVVQHAHASGLDKISIALFIPEGTASEWHFASSDYTNDTSKRPELSFSWRTGNQWLPSAASSLAPINGSEIWNMSASRPRGADNVTMNWSSNVNNETKWIMQISGDPNFTNNDNSTFTYDLSDSSTYNGTWDESNLSYTTPNDVEWCDCWIYWRVQAQQDHRLGQWSMVHSFRVPGELGSDDGAGNHTITLHEGSVFIETEALPEVPDSTIDSSRANSSHGGSSDLYLGISANGSGESKILLTFDLGELPFPAAMTPTSALLSLYRQNVTGTSSLTVSAHACDTYNENSVTWNNAPSCSSAEITRSTMLIVPPTGWMEWDVTSLAQSNVANGNMTLSIMLQAVGTPGSSSSFYSSDYWNETFRPKLILDYVDNVDGIIPPAQPTLTYPNDGAILYNTSTWVLESMDKPQLTWNAVPNATGYIVTIAEASGQLKYKSWEDSQINGTTFTFTDDLLAGEVYSWWVQAVNGSIPGPSSSRRAFAIGDPVNNMDNGDHTWTYNFQTGNEVADLGHTNVRDSYIGSGFPNQNHGSEPMVVGTDCEGANTECRMILALDNSQIPLPGAANIHSASVRLKVSDITFGGSTSMTLSVHPLLTNAWTQSGSTWNSSSQGNLWSAAGMGAGLEYASTPVSTTTVSVTDQYVWLDLGYSSMQIAGDHAWVIIGTSAAGTFAWVEFHSSEDSLTERPLVQINYTDVDAVSISPKGGSTDADTSVQFSHIITDILGGMVGNTSVVWDSSDGTISSTGVYTPWSVGTHEITACFGVICTTELITVTPGSPVDLIVSGTSASITADESFTIVAEIQDQNGNTVPGQTISYTPSNGSMNGATFMPYATGTQTVTVSWNGQNIDVTIQVAGGVPTHYMTSGCGGVIHAGETCTLNWTLHDQFDNLLDLAVGGGISWQAGGGIFTEANGTYFATTVGSWNITMASTGGINHVHSVVVDHGQMATLEINVSAEYVTADDMVWINTTRIDIMGNRLSVELPAENWTVSDGTLVAGQPAIWHANRVGTKTITAQYAGMSNSVDISVSKGEIVGLVLLVDTVDSTWMLHEITADDQMTIKVKAQDANGNRWTENVAWRVEHPQFNDQSVLQEMTYGSTTMFVPIFASDYAYTLWATYDNDVVIEVALNISVDHGDLVSVELIQPNSLTQNIDADEELLFLPQLSDSDGNLIDSSIISYSLVDKSDDATSTDITEVINGNGGVWYASTVGEYSITAWAISNEGYNISETVDIVVTHGDAVSVAIDFGNGQVIDSAMAGDSFEFYINGTDADGNVFPQSVLWSENGQPVQETTIQGSDGIYTWFATTAGDYSFKFRSPSNAENIWDINTIPNPKVDRIELTIGQESVAQLESFDIEVRTFDAWNNQIPVPAETEIKLTGRMTAEAGDNGNWTITTLDDEEQVVTITVHGNSVSETIMVEGTFMGFFEAGGPLYWAGLGLAVLIVIVLLVVSIMVLRSGNSEYDDDDDDDDDDYYEDDHTTVGPVGPGPGGPTGPGPGGPTGPGPAGPVGPGPGGPPPQAEPEPEEDTSWMVDHRVDEDGVEWAEDDTGTWWYRDPGSSEWSEWED